MKDIDNIMLFYKLLQSGETVTAEFIVSWINWPTKLNRKNYWLDKKAGRSFCCTTTPESLLLFALSKPF